MVTTAGNACKSQTGKSRRLWYVARFRACPDWYPSAAGKENRIDRRGSAKISAPASPAFAAGASTRIGVPRAKGVNAEVSLQSAGLFSELFWRCACRRLISQLQAPIGSTGCPEIFGAGVTRTAVVRRTGGLRRATVQTDNPPDVVGSFRLWPSSCSWRSLPRAPR